MWQMPHETAAAKAMVLSLSVLASLAQTDVPDWLSQARQYYNDQQYEEAIEVATLATQDPALASSAAVIVARAHLERYRIATETTDLTAAREALKRVDASELSPRDDVEFTIGLGESIFLDDQYALDDRYSTAAELFGQALGRADLLDPQGRDRLFDWWALSLDRQAQLGPESGRVPSYTRIVERAEEELTRAPDSTSAAYWLAAGAWGMANVTRALGAAMSAWVRAGALGERGLALRQDLDRLVVQVILPERAKQLAAGADARPALTSLRAQWEGLKEHWR
jgi:hypothetical protein